MSEKKNNRRKVVAVGLGIIGIAGLSLAAASQLSLSVNSNLQAGVEVLADCQTATVGVEFDSPAWNAGSFDVDGATLTNIDNECDGLDYIFVVTGAGDAALQTVTGTVGGTSITAPFSATDAEDITGVALTIYGDNA